MRHDFAADMDCYSADAIKSSNASATSFCMLGMTDFAG